MAVASASEAQVGEIVPTHSVISTIDAPPTEGSAPPAIVSADAVLVEITETVTVVVPGQKSEDDEGATIAASGIAAIEPAAPESEAKATELPEPTGIAEAQIEAAPAAVEPLSTDLNALRAIVSVEAVPVEITETVTVVVPGQKSQDIEDVEITGSEPEHPTAAPNLKRDEAPAALDDEE